MSLWPSPEALRRENPCLTGRGADGRPADVCKQFPERPCPPGRCRLGQVAIEMRLEAAADAEMRARIDAEYPCQTLSQNYVQQRAGSLPGCTETLHQQHGAPPTNFYSRLSG